MTEATFCIFQLCYQTDNSIRACQKFFLILAHKLISFFFCIAVKRLQSAIVMNEEMKTNSRLVNFLVVL